MTIFLRFKDKYAQYFAYLEKKKFKPKTIAERKQMLRDYYPESFQNKRLSSIRRGDTAILEEAGSHHGDHGRTRAIVAFRRYCDYLQAECNIKLPFDWRDVKVPTCREKEQPIFEDYELAILFKVMETMESGSVHGRRMAWTMEAYFETLFGTGLRLHEALSLRRSHFPEIHNTHKIMLMRKGGKEREINFTDRVIVKLEKYLNRRNDICDAMFVNSCGEPLIAATLKSYIQRLRRKLRGLGYSEIAAKLKSHTFRRTLATYMLENGADIKAVQLMMDHESERTTIKHYIRANKRRAQIIHRAILDKIPFEKLASRYKSVDGKVMVRTTPRGGRWMNVDAVAAQELTKLVTNARLKA